MSGLCFSCHFVQLFVSKLRKNKLFFRSRSVFSLRIPTDNGSALRYNDGIKIPLLLGGTQ